MNKYLLNIGFFILSLLVISGSYSAWANQGQQRGLYNFFESQPKHDYIDQPKKLSEPQHWQNLEPAENFESYIQPESDQNIQQTSNYILGPGDRLKITVFGEENLSGTFVINDGGFLSLPLIGDVRAEGETIKGIERIIFARLSPDYIREPSVSIEIADRKPFYVLGEVRSPGSYEYVDNITILKAVATAGGFTYRAKQDQIDIIRTEAGIKKSYKSLPLETTIRPGDVIVVEERFF